MKRQIAALLLQRISHQRSFPWEKMLHRFATPQAILRANPREWDDLLCPRKKKLLQKIQDQRKEVEDEFRQIEKEDIQLVDFGQENYPPLLREIDCPPFLLYGRGDLSLLSQESVAIIGSRRASVYGLCQAGRFATALAEVGLVIVSGLARGIDGRVHRAVLQTGGKTLAVLGSGLLHLYPRENISLAEKMVHCGLVISEFPLHAPPLRHHFPWRNRIISGLSRGIVVIEAGERSGTLITVKWALDQNREIFALPGPVDLPSTRGTHGLIRQGARLVISPQDVLREILPMIAPLPTEKSQPQKPLGLREKEVLQAIIEGANYLELLQDQSSLSLSELWGILLKLEMGQWIKRWPGNYYTVEPGKEAK